MYPISRELRAFVSKENLNSSPSLSRYQGARATQSGEKNDPETYTPAKTKEREAFASLSQRLQDLFF